MEPAVPAGLIKRDLLKRTLQFERILQTAIQNLEIAIRESKAVIEYEALPRIEADELKLAQVMQNLIGNAIKFRKPDVRPVVRISAKS